MADRLPAQSAQSSQDAHEDLLAALAASRELGPEMDQALAERYLEKHVKPGAVAQRNQQSQAITHSSPQFRGLEAVMPILGIVAYIVILIVSQGHLWWTFWIPMALGGSVWWGDHDHNHMSDEQRQQYYAQRQARREARYQYRASRHGYPYQYPPRDDGPQQASTPPATDARTPSDVL